MNAVTTFFKLYGVVAVCALVAYAWADRGAGVRRSWTAARHLLDQAARRPGTRDAPYTVELELDLPGHPETVRDLADPAKARVFDDLAEEAMDDPQIQALIEESGWVR